MSFKMVWKSNGEPVKYEDVESIFILPGRERRAGWKQKSLQSVFRGSPIRWKHQNVISP
jgi:hypothetical protein